MEPKVNWKYLAERVVEEPYQPVPDNIARHVELLPAERSMELAPELDMDAWGSADNAVAGS